MAGESTTDLVKRQNGHSIEFRQVMERGYSFRTGAKKMGCFHNYFASISNIP